jgi:hypothetical protein
MTGVLVAVVGIGLLLALVTAGLVLGPTRFRASAAGSGENLAAPPPAAPSTSARTEVMAGSTGDVPAAASEQPPAQEAVELTGAGLAECVMAQLPPGSFKEPPKVDWLCEVNDPRRGYARLRSALVLGAKGEVTTAMSLWSRVRWYGMASFTVVRASCCRQSPHFELPPTASCGSTAEILDELNDVVAAGKDHEPVMDRYTRNVRCHSRQGRDRFFGVDGELGGGQRTAFDDLVAQRRRQP